MAPLATARAAALSAGVVLAGRFAFAPLADFAAEGLADLVVGRDAAEFGVPGGREELDEGAAALVGADLLVDGAEPDEVAAGDDAAVAGRLGAGRTRVVSSAGRDPSPVPFVDATLGDASAVIGDAPPPGIGRDVPSGP